MPMVAAGAVLSGIIAGSSITALTIGFSWTAFAGSLILGGLSRALTPKVKSNSTAAAENPGTVAVRQSDLTRTILYGSTRTVRGYAHMESTNTNKDLHLFYILCQGPLRDITEIWVDDYCIPRDWLDANGKVTQGRYAGYMQIRKHLGAVDQEADPVAITNLDSWSTSDRGQGIAYLYVIMNKNQDIYPTGVPNITAIMEGVVNYDPRVSAPRWGCNIALFAYDYLTNPRYGFATAPADIDITNIAAQASICDEIVSVTDEPFAATAVTPATDIITLTGDILTLQYGDQVQVSSTGTIPAGLAAATNYYVIPYQIKDTPRIKLATSFVNAMATTAIDITSAGTGTITVTKKGEPRYNGAGIIDTEKNLSDNLNDIVSSMAGRAINIAGAWTLLAGAWRTPSVRFGIDDMRNSGIGFSSCLSMSESFNVVKGLFNGPSTSYQDTDYPSAQYDTFINQDLGIIQSKPLNLPFTSRPTTAQRIAKIELFRGRQEIAFTCDFSMKGLQVQPGDVVGMDVDYMGWTNKPFEITSLTFDIGPSGLFTKMEMRETAQAIYDWSAGEAIDYDPAPNTDLPNPYTVSVPSGVFYNSRIITTTQGDTVATLRLGWDLHPDAFVREYGQLEIEYKKSTDTEWSPSFKVSGTIIETDVVTASIGTYYDLRIRAINNVGVRSNWSELDLAIVGSSGGVTVSDDWGSVAASAVTFKDWGAVNASPTGFADWGYA